MEFSELISIITPTYNSRFFIQETIKSVLFQTYPFWEMIIVDDCSTDNTVQIIDEISKNEPRIKWKKLSKNHGIAFTRNDAISMAQGRFLTFLDHDDIWLPNKLKKQVSFMIENDYHFTYTTYQTISENGKLINQVVAPLTITYHQFIKNTIIGFLTVMIDRNTFPIVKFENLLCDDLLLWMLLLKTENGHGIQECLAQYRIVKGSASRNKLKTAKSLWIIYRRYEKLSLIYSIHCFVLRSVNSILKRLR